MAAGLRWRLRAAHTIPTFAGGQSRQHERVPLWRLKAEAALHRLRAGRRLEQIETFVQFAGFPRSGHSLIGSIIDAHPQARVAHELDAMGLLNMNFSARQIVSLLDKKALEFTRHGRHWNGYCYYVEGGHHESAAPLRVLGDKKGDGAVRWIAKNPELLEALNSRFAYNNKWILVLRNPWDNIATMSLRKGRMYDTLRMQATEKADFARRLTQAQQAGDIAEEALDDQIDDYAKLCATVARIKQATSPSDWFELAHEHFSTEPETVIEQLCGFLSLEPDTRYIENCARLVHPTPNASRALVKWPSAKQERVTALINEFSFLSRYAVEAD